MSAADAAPEPDGISLLIRENLIAALIEWRARRKLTLRLAARLLGIHFSKLSVRQLHGVSLERLLQLIERTDYCFDFVLSVGCPPSARRCGTRKLPSNRPMPSHAYRHRP